MRLLNADCFEALKGLADNSIDAVVTDPPYGLGRCSPAEVAECMIAWAKGEAWTPKGSGFLGKAWDAWVPPPELWREVLRVLKPGGHGLIFAGSRTQDLMGMSLRLAGFEMRDVIQWLYGSGFPKSHDVSKALDKLAGSEREERRWDGWGTALKPAYEPALLVRKPLSGTVADNVLSFGVGGLNVDGCRIETTDQLGRAVAGWQKNGYVGGETQRWSGIGITKEGGRFPANIILDQVTAQQLDQQADSVSRFFYCAKSSQSERNAGIKTEGKRGNIHPTVKPIDLMRYLARLITPPGGIVLDPFMGSGTTGCACALEGFDFIGIEREPDYFEIAQSRIKHWGGEGVELLEFPPEPSEPKSDTLPLFEWIDG